MQDGIIGVAPSAGGPWWRALPRAVVALDTEGRLIDVNEPAARLLGLDPEAARGRPFEELAFVEGDRGGFGEVLRLVLGGVRWSGELRLALGTTSTPAQLQVVRVEDNGVPCGAVLVVDAVGADDVETAHLSERLTRLARVAAELQSTRSLESLTNAVISHMADAAGATTASLSVLVDEDTLALVGLRGGPPGAGSRWATYSVDDSTPAGLVMRTRQPLLMSGRAAIAERYPALGLGAEGERSMLCLPLVIDDRSLGVATLAFPTRREMSEAELDFFRIMADACAQSLDRLRALEMVEDQHEKLTFLAQASVELASSLDYEATLRSVAWLAVPRLADWCAISLEQDGVLRALAVAHVDPDKVALAQELQERYPADPSDENGSYQVLRTGESILVPEIPEEMLEAAAKDAEHLRLIRALNLRSGLTVALKARGRTFGVITWVNGETGRRFGRSDVEFGEDIARRAAVAIDNSLLHSELRQIADRLQEAVLPAALPTLPGWELASSYSSAGKVDVGGDFYDAIPLGGDRLALVIGDVMGRGVEAAAAMAQIRAAFRAFIAVDPDPAAVMGRLDLFYEQFPTDQLVTVLYAVANPRRDEVVLACAGHPPPLLLSPSGAPEFIEAARGTLLGAGPAERTTTTVGLKPGQTLLMFTDGLIERRNEDLEQSKERLLEVCGSLPDGPDGLDLEALATTMRDPTRDDDIAILAARRSAIPTS
ncbi:MAG TPA: SpoIIE family protein phosphatase [Marmoricola sp.]|nr:SpoIIE family protein phosphatase [Marmoricola sp.]